MTASLGKIAQIKMGWDTLSATALDTLELLEVSIELTSSEFSANTKDVSFFKAAETGNLKVTDSQRLKNSV